MKVYMKRCKIIGNEKGLGWGWIVDQFLACFTWHSSGTNISTKETSSQTSGKHRPYKKKITFFFILFVLLWRSKVIIIREVIFFFNSLISGDCELQVTMPQERMITKAMSIHQPIPICNRKILVTWWGEILWI